MNTFSQKLDIESENIIYLLSLDSRQSVSTLAKELNLNRKIVENRVQNLFEIGFIKPLLVINEKSRFRSTILVKLNKIDNSVLEKVKKISGFMKLKETLGLYDLSFLFDAPSAEEMESSISKVSNLLHKDIVTFDVQSHDFEDTMGYKSFCHAVGNLAKYKQLNPKSYVLTEDEKKVLLSLKQNPRVSYSSLEAETGITFVRLKKMMSDFLQSEIIRFTVDPNYDLLELQFHNFLVKTKLGKKDVFEQYIQKHPRVHWVKYARGRWDYVLSITAQTINEFIDITKQIRSDNHDLILDETALISKVKEIRRY
ncbi:Lrp/AsnC family transcriptional regulator [Candidatus Woesearchaeota archaeon]|nr:Lrp/AsnC family transcriptional regulator [Candidatus Woesearchaeota archaeon]